GLYTLRGLERRARELTADAVRRRAPLACVALGLELDPKGTGQRAAALPATAPEGAARMARRLSRVIETAGPRPAGVPPLRVHAGYDAVTDVHQTPVEPASLLEHAGTALHQARGGAGERIRAYK